MWLVHGVPSGSDSTDSYSYWKEDDFIDACGDGKVNRVKSMLENGGFLIDHMNHRYEHALLEACKWPIYSDSKIIVKMLIEVGCNINIKTFAIESNALIIAVEKFMELIVEDDYCTVKKYRDDFIEMLKMLIDGGCDVNCKNKYYDYVIKTVILKYRAVVKKSRKNICKYSYCVRNILNLLIKNGVNLSGHIKRVQGVVNYILLWKGLTNFCVRYIKKNISRYREEIGILPRDIRTYF